ncbi:MAG: BolA/IbaG family iron-sulfur metabolism protein [Candidatus Gracilibacteria bacterium]
MFDYIIEAIKKAIPDAEVIIRDPRNDGVHLAATVISKEFEGKGLVAQHRMVMNALKEEFKEDLHALSLTTKVKKEE